MLFLGEYRLSFSGQGRIVIPKKIREAIGKSKVITLTKGFDRCLACFRNEDWEKGATEFLVPSLLKMQKGEMKRHLFSSALIVDIDEQGRIVIPKNLLEYAGLSGKEVTLVGVGTHFEVWNPEKWDTYIKQVEGNIKNISEEQ